MVSKSQIKLITSLEQKKGRSKTGLFMVEGRKGIAELLSSPFKLHSLFTAEDIFVSPQEKTFTITQAELKKISRLKTAQTAVALFEIPTEKRVNTQKLIVALDGVRDPGNLGTIIRLCDWFGIEDLVCSVDTVDCYNPKVVQATMGSITRVNIVYKNLLQFLEENPSAPKWGTFLDGSNIYKSEISEKGIIILGNEANGISSEIEEVISSKIHIPQFGTAAETESLNVATATAIVLSEFKRRTIN
ncbi:RNA methyltransferase [Antarcticibacterium sp. 1MA-6-2]|uniref:TrmH family RNA methyltransferase n=1 Tax=Antarcticibacterium sp. 1MA-6-2 TaxID=2908210 RepID=UPI001F18E03B|nr:RNA methyltransferase [Antarcticibacterium sp. 1MA-6-2]UJH91050.1 RNA methyltransferase [Antarcticibacterium sp. 1MA-6-2]